MRYDRLFILLLLMSLLCATSSLALRDGKRFDTGATMTTRAEGAPKALDRLAFMRGQWDVTHEAWEGDSIANRVVGQAEITYMNRGHGLMERFYAAEFTAGEDLATIAFIVHNKSGVWMMGVANSYTENISVHSGDFEGDVLVLHNALRPKGGARLLLYQTRILRTGDDAFSMETLVSTNAGVEWSREAMRHYSRRSPSDDLLASESTYGEPAPGLPEEARQFDFLIGEWSNKHDMTLPNGQNVKFPTSATAVYVLDGHAVMEFSWYDVDPNLPDAATSIVRIYNRQMRRWECMYTTNRFGSILYFGGVMEGDRIVLHLFDANAGDRPISQWIFHDWKEDSYHWYANTSNDRGETWQKTWIIDATRK